MGTVLTVSIGYTYGEGGLGNQKISNCLELLMSKHTCILLL